MVHETPLSQEVEATVHEWPLKKQPRIECESMHTCQTIYFFKQHQRIDM